MIRFGLTTGLIAALALGIGWGAGRWRTSAPTGGRGAVLYQVHCASCHGPDGRGDGPAVTSTPPRDFAGRPWRFAPTVESIRQVTRDGVPDAGMPGFAAALAPADLDLLADYVHQMSQRPGGAFDKDRGLLQAAGFVEMRGHHPPIQTTSASGEVIDLASFRGRLTIVHFWGTSCRHCIAEMPALDALAKKHAGRVAVLHVCADEDDAAVAQAMLDKFSPGSRALVDSSGLAVARFGAWSLPTVWLIDAEGRAIGKASGARDWSSADIESLIGRHLPGSVRQSSSEP